MNIIDQTINLLMNNKAYQSDPTVRGMVQHLGIRCSESKLWSDAVVEGFEAFDDDGHIAGHFLSIGYLVRELELREQKEKE